MTIKLFNGCHFKKFHPHVGPMEFLRFPIFPLVSIIVTIACWSIMMAAEILYKVPTPEFISVRSIYMLWFRFLWYFYYGPLLSSSFTFRRGNMRAGGNMWTLPPPGPSNTNTHNKVTLPVQVEGKKFSSITWFCWHLWGPAGHSALSRQGGVRSDSPKPQDTIPRKRSCCCRMRETLQLGLDPAPPSLAPPQSVALLLTGGGSSAPAQFCWCHPLGNGSALSSFHGATRGWRMVQSRGEVVVKYRTRFLPWRLAAAGRFCRKVSCHC